MIRVAIVADSPRMRRELAQLLVACGRFELAARSAATPDAARADAVPLDVAPADVVLLYAASSTDPAPLALDELAGALVLITDDDELITTLRPFRAGLALLPTTATDEQLISAIEAAASGLTVLHPDLASSLDSAPGDDPLTPREREVLHMLAAGHGNRDIAARLGISDHTAKFHVSQILAKLNAATRAEAVSIAMRRGLVPL